jgi:CRP/FNR family cyclic AMP-dependent transcriptional regulator
MPKQLSHVFNVQSGESRFVMMQAGLIFFVSAGGAIGGSAIDALFYARFGAQYLPYLYMAVSGITFLVLMSMTALTARVSRAHLYRALPLILALILIADWLMLGFHFHWFYPVLWLSMSVIGTVQSLYVWGLAGSIVDTRQAKRLFPLFGASVILGAIVGGFLTAPLARWLQTENLLLIWIAGLLIAFALGNKLIRQAAGQLSAPRVTRRRRAVALDEIKAGYRFVRSSRLMRWIVVSSVLFSILAYSLSLPFARSAASEFPGTDQLAGFLGVFQGITTTAALLMSLFVANRLYARFGLTTARLGLPVIYALGFGVLMAFPLFPVIVVLRFTEQLWSQGVSSAAYQAVFNVVPSQRRDQTRTFISAVPDQIGTFAAGLILVVGQQALPPQSLYLLGLITAIGAMAVLWQQKRAYAAALVAALRDGQPQVFVSEAAPFSEFQHDAAAFSIVLAGLSSSEASARRVSLEVLSELPAPQASSALSALLHDPDTEVRVLALKALARAKATAALIEIAACLDDSQPEVRAQAVATLHQLADQGRGLAQLISPLLDDKSPATRARAALTLFSLGESALALHTLQQMLESVEVESRLAALRALGELRDAAMNEWIVAALNDPLPCVRQAAAQALPASISNSLAPRLVLALGDDDPVVQDAIAAAIGRVGPALLDATVSALSNPALEIGALAALEYLPVQHATNTIRGYAEISAARAVHYHDLRQGIHLNGDERVQLLADSLHDAAQRRAVNALRAIGLQSNRDAMRTAIANVTSRDPNQRANAIETLEAIGNRDLVRPLLAIWESSASTDVTWPAGLAELLNDDDAWLRDCAALVQAAPPTPGGNNMHTLPTLSLMERVLFLRRAPLFAGLAPIDVKHIAALADERLFQDAELIARQGDPGDEMFIIVSGEVAVRERAAGQSEQEVTRRCAGDVVGEMAVISQEPRVASLIALGPVRLLSVDRKQFEGMLRERPEIGLAVMRVLIARLKEREAELARQG